MFVPEYRAARPRRADLREFRLHGFQHIQWVVARLPSNSPVCAHDRTAANGTMRRAWGAAMQPSQPPPSPCGF